MHTRHTYTIQNTKKTKQCNGTEITGNGLVHVQSVSFYIGQFVYRLLDIV